jgi:hypothetical protein
MKYPADIQKIITNFQASVESAQKAQGYALGNLYFASYIADFLAHDVSENRKNFFLGDIIEYTKSNREIAEKKGAA